MKNNFLLVALLVLTVVVLGRALVYFTGPDTGILGLSVVHRPHWFSTVLRLHVAAGGLAMVAGIWQLVPRLRRTYPAAHRAVGRVYGTLVLVGAGAGLALAPHSLAGGVSATGFGLLAVLWAGTTLGAVSAARRGAWPAHRRWVAYSLALTYSAITFRLFLLVPLLTTAPFLTVYGYGSWGCWLVNLGLVFVYRHRRGRAGRIVVVGLLLAAPVIPRGLLATTPPVALTYELRVRVERITPPYGTLRVCLVDRAEHFLQSCFRSAEAVPTGKAATVRLTAVPAGAYAVLLYHDRDDNGRLNRDGPFGLPSEPYGFSNNPRGWFGPPAFDRCRFSLGGDTTLVIKL